MPRGASSASGGGGGGSRGSGAIDPGAGRGDVLEHHPRVAAIEDERHVLGLLRQEGKQPPQLVGADVVNPLGAAVVRDDRADLPRGRLAGGVLHARAVAAVVEDDNGIIRRPADEVVLEGLNDGGVGGLLVGQDPDRVVRKVKFAPEQSLHVAHVGDAPGEAVDGLVLVDADQQRKLPRLSRWPGACLGPTGLPLRRARLSLGASAARASVARTDHEHGYRNQDRPGCHSYPPYLENGPRTMCRGERTGGE